MQKSKTPQTSRPVEILDTELLQQVGGGLPKGTWNEPDPVDQSKENAPSDPTQLPKGTW